MKSLPAKQAFTGVYYGEGRRERELEEEGWREKLGLEDQTCDPVFEPRDVEVQK
jgi:hypothetical protein